MHKYDCLRANKSTMAWGLEARVPFLDREFLEYVMTLDPAVKMAGSRVEKWILRKAFDVPDQPYLPAEVRKRKKNLKIKFRPPATPPPPPRGSRVGC